MSPPGIVYLVGAGPGDPELMTLKAMKALAKADVVVYDRLVSKEVLELAPSGAALIDVGKRPRHHPVPQDEINDTLVRLAKSGRCVVRLKGGDPFLFGRGGEEALTLARARIPFEVIPGITSAQGCAASARTPLTHRTLATSLRFITGHCQADKALDYDWSGLSDAGTTLVVYMGMANIASIAAQLIAHGRDAATPVMAVSRGTQPQERRVVSVLDRIAEDVSRANLESPVLFVIGEIVGLADVLKTERNENLLQNVLAAG